jgi:RNA polymerase-binding protein DksA
MNFERINFYREMILMDREELIRSLVGIRREIADFMEHQPIEYNERGEEETALNLLARLDYRQKKELSLMEEALARIQSGTFGICFRCGNDIPEDRLTALPYTSICKTCAIKETSA